MSYLDPQDQVVRPMRRGAVRPSPVFIGILALFVVGCVLAWLDLGSRGFDVFLMIVGGWLVSLCLHEFAHALVAYRAGDTGVVDRGYLQLNPLKYAHWLLSIALPLLFIIAGGIALPGGAVMIDHGRIRSRAQDTAVSLAGPAVNLVFAGVLALPFATGVDLTTHPVFWSGVAYLAFLQLMAGIFNLLPIPGLDGGNAIYPWLSPQAKRGFNAFRPYGFIIVLLLLWQSSVGAHLLDGIENLLQSFGVTHNAIVFGQEFFRFWTTQPSLSEVTDLINF